MESYTALFLVTAIGLALGNIKIKGISLGTSAVIFSAIFLGHFGISIPPPFKQVGLILFMYSIGIQAGPGFFAIFTQRSKWRLLYISVLIVALEAGLAIGLKYIFNYDNATIAGVFAGSLSTSAGLAVAIGGSEASIASAAFGLVYPIGVLLIVLFMLVAPKIFKINIKDEEAKYIENTKAENPDIVTKHYRLENKNLFGKTIAQSEIRSITGATIFLINHNSVEIKITPKTVLNEGDVIYTSGTPKIHEQLQILIGNEVEQVPHIIDKDSKYTVKQILITNKDIINKPLSETVLSSNYGVSVTHIRRSGVDIIPRPHIKLRFADRITVTCPKNNAQSVVKLLGGSKNKLNDINFLPISIGILLGILLGSITIPIGSITIKLGLTGGVLISGLVLGRIGKTGNIIWNMSGTPNMFLRKLGLIFFMAVIGTEAGEHFVELFLANGPSILISSMIIVLVPLFVVAMIGYYYLKMDFLTLLGTLTGAMTSTPGLSAIENVSETNAARVSYATVYPFSLVLVLIVCQLLMLL